LPLPAPKVEEIDPQQLADRARTLQRLLGRAISIEQAVEVARADTGNTLPAPHVVGVLARVEIAQAREKGLSFSEVPTVERAVAIVRERWGATANEAV
jgi:hypothetical protein